MPPTPQNATTVPSTAMSLISPTTLLHAHLSQTPPTRPSTRSPSQPQQIDLNTSSLTHTYGSSVVKIGATTIVCGVHAEILPTSSIASYDPKTTNTSTITSQPQSPPIQKSQLPESHTPISLYNLLVPNLELSTGCSPLHPATAAPSTQAQSLSQRLYSLLLTTHLINPTDLEVTYTPPPETDADLSPDDPAYIPRITEVKAFWVLYIDMVCISYGGEASVFDAAWLSLYAALRDTVLPEAWWDADLSVVICSPDTERGKKLQIQACPVPLGFGVVNTDFERPGDGVKRWVLVDPDAFEEQCCDETGCVTVDLSTGSKGKIVRIEKCGGGAVGVKEVKEVVGCAEQRWREWQAVLKSQGNGKAKNG